MPRNREGEKKIKPIPYKATGEGKQKMQITTFPLTNILSIKQQWQHTPKNRETLENCKAIPQIELNTLNQVSGDIKNKYYLERKTQKLQTEMKQKSSKKCNDNWSLSEGIKKRGPIFEINKLQNVQGRMDVNENLTRDTEERQENKRMKMRWRSKKRQKKVS